MMTSTSSGSSAMAAQHTSAQQRLCHHIIIMQFRRCIEVSEGKDSCSRSQPYFLLFYLYILASLVLIKRPHYCRTNLKCHFDIQR